MPYYVVGVDASEEAERLISARIRYLGGQRVLKSLWLLETDRTPQQLRNLVLRLVEPAPRIFVAEFGEKPVVKNARPGTGNWIKVKFAGDAQQDALAPGELT
jgi:hypothetical protein